MGRTIDAISSTESGIGGGEIWMRNWGNRRENGIVNPFDESTATIGANCDVLSVNPDESVASMAPVCGSAPIHLKSLAEFFIG